MVVAFYFRLHLAYFPRPVVAIFARPEHQSGDEMNSFIPTTPLPAYFCSIDTKTLRGSLMPMR